MTTKKKRFHVAENGPAPCTASVRSCRYAHYESLEKAEEAYQESLIVDHGQFVTLSKVPQGEREKAIRDRLEASDAKLSDTVSHALAVTVKQNELIDRIKRSEPSAIPKEAYEELEAYEKQLWELRHEERRAFHEYKLAELDAVEAGLKEKPEKENVFKSRGARWTAKLGMGYSEMNPSFDPSLGLPGETKQSLVSEYAAWSGKDLYEARARLNELAALAQESDMSFDQLLTKEFQDTAFGESTRNRVFIDLETSSLDPFRGEIIEIGIVVMDPKGNIIETVNERYDVENPEVRDRLGLGASDVHKIYPEDVAGKPKFSDPSVQRRIGDILNNENCVIVPHNAGFEHGHLSTHLEGYYSSHVRDSTESLRKRTSLGEPGKPTVKTQDTRALSTYLMKSKRNNLQSFATNNGISKKEYQETAHGAYADADMTARAFTNFQQNLSMMPAGEKFIGADYDGDE